MSEYVFAFIRSHAFEACRSLNMTRARAVTDKRGPTQNPARQREKEREDLLKIQQEREKDDLRKIQQEREREDLLKIQQERERARWSREEREREGEREDVEECRRTSDGGAKERRERE